jgi:hypothetical protein
MPGSEPSETCPAKIAVHLGGSAWACGTPLQGRWRPIVANNGVVDQHLGRLSADARADTRFQQEKDKGSQHPWALLEAKSGQDMGSRSRVQSESVWSQPLLPADRSQAVLA